MFEWEVDENDLVYSQMRRKNEKKTSGKSTLSKPKPMGRKTQRKKKQIVNKKMEGKKEITEFAKISRQPIG